MPHLTLTLFGPPHIVRDGQPISLDTRKAMALLAYLAVTGQRHSRDALAALLYPEADQSRARATLRRTLSSLKSAIDDPSLVVEREAVALASGADLWCDVTHFQRLLAQCQSHGHGTHDVCPRCLAPLHEAAALYQDEFLAGFTLRDSTSFDDWQRFETERLRRDLNAALERLVRLLTIEGDLAAAIGQAQRLLASDPLHEPAHRVLMLLYVWTGQEQSALRQYRACVRALNEELGVAPLPETTQVYEAIKERRTPPPPASLRAATRATAPPPATPPREAPAAAPSTPLPLVGRANELAALAALFGQVQADGRLAALEGEPGIGKTRLAEEFLSAATAAGVASLAGRCFEGEAGLAYGVWIDALRAALARPTLAQRLLAAPDSALAEAARLLPELAAGRSLPPVAPLDHPGAQARFFEGLCQVLQALVGSRGVLFLDDLHWADDASLDVLHYLVHRLAGRPLLVLAAWRSEDSPAVQRLRNLARDAQRAGVSDMRHLSRLTVDDILVLVDALPGAPAAPANLGQRLYRQSEGLPLFATEYLAVWRAAGGAADAQTLPQGVRSLLQARLAQVDEAGQQLLAAGAVIGRSFDFETLRAASGRSEEEVVDSLEALVRQGLVREASPSDPLDTYDFSHEQLRALVYAQTGLARRRLLHRRVAEALQRQQRPAKGPGAAAGQIGHHLQLAGREEEAAGYFWQAGQHARALYANAEALTYFETALALGYPDSAALHEAIGDLHTLSGRYGLARSAYERAAAQTMANAQPAHIEHKLALLHHRQGDWTLAESHFQAAHQAWPTGDVAGQAHLLADRSLNAHRQGKQRQATELAEEALHLAELVQDAASLARAHNALGLLARSRGDLTNAAEHLSQGLAQAEALGDPSSRAAALNNLALVCQAQGDSARAIELTRQALALCEAQGDRHRAAALRNNLADLLHAAGQPDAAMDQLKQAVAVFAEIGETASGPWQPEIWKLVAW
jgi:DNA-binding SARP family transcriptional activator